MLIAVTSEPACGSDIAIAVTTPPLAMIGRYLAALLLGAEVKQRHDEHGVERRDRGAGRRNLGDLLAREAGQGQVAVRAAIAFRHPELHQPHLAEQLHEFEREAVGLVDLGRDRRDVFCDHLPHGVAERDLLLGEAHVDPWVIFSCRKPKRDFH